MTAMRRDTGFWNVLGRVAPWLGTPGVLKAVVLLNALTFVLVNIDPAFEFALKLDPEKIKQGEVWRLVTYIFVPEAQGFWIIFALLFLWFLSSSLEEIWGPLRLNVFYIVGMLGCTVAAFFFGGGPSNTFLNLSLFFAFATVAPDYEVFLFFLVRVKIKYLAWVLAGIFALQFLALPVASKMAMAVSLANYLVFFAPAFFRGVHQHRRRTLHAARLPASGDEESLHHCKACGRTEISHPDLHFRVAASGEEYCLEHLPPR